MTPKHAVLATVDLGSNSFRLFIGRAEESKLGVVVVPVDEWKETVRLAGGLDKDRHLSEAAQEIALAALRRFSERLRTFKPERVRAVATSTMRVAKNAGAFLPLAEAALGFPIEIISGREEARLIYVGAAHSLPTNGKKRLVVDIGGGSTECIIGRDYEAILTESVGVGCVSSTANFFPKGNMNEKAFKECILAARARIAQVTDDYFAEGWHEAIGTSGTARSLTQVCDSLFGSPVITGDRLEQLQAMCVKAGHSDEVKLEGLRPDRRAVLPGGLATMRAVFEELQISKMTYASGALREGVMYDQIGRENHADMREVAVAGAMARYKVNEQQASRIARTAEKLFLQLVDQDHPDRAREAQLLRWSAMLHEVGQAISHDHYHKHSAYILDHADLPGFSQTEQHELAFLLLGHQGKLNKLLAQSMRPELWKLLLALRLSVLLHRKREEAKTTPIQILTTGQKIKIRLPHDWLAQHPLTDFLIQAEVSEWTKVNIWKAISFERFDSDLG